MEGNRKVSKPLSYYMRAIHRVLGYLVVGMVMIYAVSGIVLIHRTGDFMKKSTRVEQTLEPGMDARQLADALRIKNMKVIDETDATITFADGSYDKASGAVVYDKKELVSPLNKFTDLHKLPDAKNPHIAFATTLFGVILFLLALTSLFMYKPSSKQFKANMIYTGIGVIVALLLVMAI